MEIETLLIIGLAFALGGILKGASGVGAPLIAVPVMTSFYDIRFAVAVFILPNMITNLIQTLIYRGELKNHFFLLVLCLSAGCGALAGSFMLYEASSYLLELLMAVIVLLFVGFRLHKPNWKLSMQTAQKLNAPVGFLAGFLQGTFGISVPATLTFLNAIKFERKEFIVIMSAFFLTVSVVQLPTLMLLGIMNIEHIYLGLLAVVPLIVSMPIGAIMLKKTTPEVFEKLILIILVGVAVRILWVF